MERNPAVSPSSHLDRKARAFQIRILGVGLIFLALMLVVVLVGFWPADLKNTEKICFLYSDICVASLEKTIFILVMAAGGLGSFVHTAKSFGDFVGNGKFVSSWIWWYVLKPFIGMALAVVLYLVVRGGFLSVGSDAGNINLYGLVAMASMAGMFSKQATDKLSEVFDTLFKTSTGSGDAKREDHLKNPVPTIARIEPASVDARTQTLTLIGTGFVKESVARINGVDRDTSFIDATKITVLLLPDDVGQVGQFDVVAFNPAPGGGDSVPISIPVAKAAGASAGGPPGSPDEHEEHLDGCDCIMGSDTADEDLPPSTGGVTS